MQSYFGSAMLKASEWKGQSYLAHIVKELISSNQSSTTSILVHEVLQTLGVTASKLIEECVPFQKDLRQSMVQIVKFFKSYPVEYVSALCITTASTMHVLAKNKKLNECASQVTFYVDRAYDEINSHLQNGNLDLQRHMILLAYKASIQLLKVKYNFNTKFQNVTLQDGYKEVMESCKAAIDLFSTKSTEWKDLLPHNVANSLKWTITTVFQHYYVDNLCMLGAENMTLLYDFGASYGKATLGIEGIVGSLLLKGEQTERASYLVSLIQETEHSKREGKELSDRISSLVHDKSKYSLDELIQCLLSQTVEIESYSRISNSLQELEESFTTLEREFPLKFSTNQYTEEGGEAALDFATNWWLSSCQTALAHGYYNIGEIERALICIRSCVDFCKLGLKAAASVRKASVISMHELGENNFLTTFISFTGFTELFRSRIYDCYESMAQMYCGLGDHKRAKSYTISSGESLGLFPRDMLMSNYSTVTDMLRIINPNVITIRHMIMRNTIINIFSLTNQGNDNIDELKFMFVEEVSSTISNMTITTQNLDWLRESSRYFILCK